MTFEIGAHLQWTILLAPAAFYSARFLYRLITGLVGVFLDAMAEGE